jgi:uncharacterized membrane protein (UPF0127 family)
MLALGLALLGDGTGHAAGKGATPATPRAQVVLAGEAFSVELADTPALQAKGLGGRARLGPREGMLFLYAERRRHAFWMKGMLISIDMIWLDNSRIVHIEHRVPPPPAGMRPQGLPTYAPREPANAAELGLAIGDFARFIFPRN